jgi:hypothetical protein
MVEQVHCRVWEVEVIEATTRQAWGMPFEVRWAWVIINNNKLYLWLLLIQLAQIMSLFFVCEDFVLGRKVQLQCREHMERSNLLSGVTFDREHAKLYMVLCSIDTFSGSHEHHKIEDLQIEKHLIKNQTRRAQKFAMLK